MGYYQGTNPKEAIEIRRPCPKKLFRRLTCEKIILLKSSCSFSTCLRASPYIDAALDNISSLMFSDPYLQQSSDNLVPGMHDTNTLRPKHYHGGKRDQNYHQE